jgi:triacylglycerol esterase/lipase EstA (alpha/beta hydrolase family)
MTELVHVGVAAGKPAGDVVFVHGLCGNARDTWSADNGVYWAELIARAFPNLNVWALDYDADALEWRGGHALFVEDRAPNVLDKLNTSDLGKAPLFWICHSYGGIFLKATLQYSEKSGNIFNNIFSHTKAIIFVATPHGGAEIASFAQRLRIVLRPSPIVQELTALNPKLQRLDEWFCLRYSDKNSAAKCFTKLKNTDT